MAGVTTRLRRLFTPEFLSRRVLAYGYALLASAGSWLAVLASMLLIRTWLLHNAWITVANADAFSIGTAYCFIFGQLLFSPGQFVIARFVADELYAQRADRLLPGACGWLTVQAGASSLLWAGYMLLQRPPLALGLVLGAGLLAANALFTLQLLVQQTGKRNTGIWWLAGGCGLAVLAAGICASQHWWLPGTHGVTVTLLGIMVTGLVIADLGTLSTLLHHLPLGRRMDWWAWREHFRRHPALAAGGLGYALGLWGSNILYWATAGTVVSGAFWTNRIYDTSTFWAYLIIAPIYPLLFLAVQTRFYPYYRKVLSQVNNGGRLGTITRSQDRLHRVLRAEIGHIFRTQAMLTVAVLLVLWVVTAADPLFSLETSILEVTIVGACLNSFVLVALLMQLYLDDRRGAALTGIVFGAATLLATALLSPLGLPYYGFGLVAGALCGITVGLPRLFWYSERFAQRLFLAPGLG
ncbi:exopolysaccharide Pel transporter PelG [Schleiferilactobacillus shenzhenensis]|nr:exopolysaccharide Pel transporter PelG [Schleiferilactobacillus shenzhenensis]